MTTREILTLYSADKKGMAHCPTHDDKKRSLHISAGRNGETLVKDHGGCATEIVLAAKNLKLSDLFTESKTNSGARAIEATYDYRDEDGKLLFQAIRYAPKDFKQRRPDGAGGFIYNLQGVPRVLYRLPELIAADSGEIVFLVEGEKDVDRLRAGGLVATCSPMGAGKWRDEYAKFLAGRKVVIIPDNDQPGRDHAQAEAKSLRGVAVSGGTLTLPGLPEKGDVSDWLSLGGTIETLRAMAEAALGRPPDADPQPEPERIAISWGELCEMKLERRETILHEVERGEIVMCPAITNRGKTTLWRNISLSIACGREFAPIIAAGEPRSVLYLDFETRLYRARADITKMLGKLTQAERALISTNLHLIADCRINGRPLTLSNPNHLEIVEKEAERVKADVIILDTLTAAFEVENENDNAEAARVMKKLTAMALRLNCVIVFLHHIGKAKQEEGQTAHAVHRARGASAYAGFSHAIFSLLPDPEKRERNTLECAKVKGERFDDTILNLDQDSRWFTSAGVVEKAPSVADQIIAKFNGKP
ncbi:MAG TPA: AAA family ATPase, partial [Blastocatellia bacterium]|nr:AAA family ATPase [Blastocatellia bacterium]